MKKANPVLDELKAILSAIAANASKAEDDGEGNMHDTVMLFAALGWDNYKGKGEVVTEYFPSSGTEQTNVVFSLDE